MGFLLFLLAPVVGYSILVSVLSCEYLLNKGIYIRLSNCTNSLQSTNNSDNKIQNSRLKSEAADDDSLTLRNDKQELQTVLPWN